jgi:hypothetical protein
MHRLGVLAGERVLELGLQDRQRRAQLMACVGTKRRSRAKAEDETHASAGRVAPTVVAAGAPGTSGGGRAGRARLGERHELPALLAPELEPHGAQPVAEGQRRHAVEDLVLVVRPLEVVVGDA